MKQRALYCFIVCFTFVCSIVVATGFRYVSTQNAYFEITDNVRRTPAATINVVEGEVERQGRYNVSVARGWPFTLNCSLILPKTFFFSLYFSSPNDKAFQEGRYQTYKKSDFKNNRKITFIIKNILEATEDDEGTYNCFFNVTFKYQTIIQNVTPIYVKVIDVSSPTILSTNLNKSTMILTADFNEVLTCQADGVPKPNIIWLKDNRILEESEHVQFTEDNQNLHLMNLGRDSKGRYTCRVSNMFGTVEEYIDMEIEESRTTLIITLVSVFVIFTIVCIIIVYMMQRIKKEKHLRAALTTSWLNSFEEGAVSSINPELGVDQQAELLPYDPTWEFNRDRLELGQQLGSGEYGVVLRATAIGISDHETMSTVAVKMVRKCADALHIKSLASELKIMSHLGKHLNVVNLLGACTKNLLQRELLVIVEYCKYGNLQRLLLRHRHTFVDQLIGDIIDDNKVREFIENKKKVKHVSRKRSDKISTCPEPVTRRHDSTNSSHSYQWTSNHTENTDVSDQHSEYDKLRIIETSSNDVDDSETRVICTHDLLCWSYQISRGMDYLVSRKVLHGDLAARNVLLAENNVVKICDFGLAKSVYQDQNYYKKDNIPLPVKWMAVESIQDQVFSTQSDVWSFGIVLWELFSLAKTPYPGLLVDKELIDKLIGGYRMDKPQYATTSIYELMRRCWLHEPTERPSFSEIEELLGNMLQNSVKNHYIVLNATYMMMNQLRDTDYLTMMSAPTYCNEVISKQQEENYVNMPCADSPQQTENVHEYGYLTMRGSKNVENVLYSNQNSSPSPSV